MTTNKSKAKTTAKHQTTAPNQSAAASAWGIPIAVLRAAKAAGCEAFTTSGRIHREPFMAWLAENSDQANTATAVDLEKAEKSELEREKLKSQIALLRSRNEREERVVIQRDFVKQAWAAALSLIQEEARMSINDDDRYRVFCERIQAGLGALAIE